MEFGIPYTAIIREDSEISQIFEPVRAQLPARRDRTLHRFKKERNSTPRVKVARPCGLM